MEHFHRPKKVHPVSTDQKLEAAKGGYCYVSERERESYQEENFKGILRSCLVIRMQVVRVADCVPDVFHFTDWMSVVTAVLIVIMSRA